jgi:hypothetical protein
MQNASALKQSCLSYLITRGDRCATTWNVMPFRGQKQLGARKCLQLYSSLSEFEGTIINLVCIGKNCNLAISGTFPLVPPLSDHPYFDIL